jgi:uncharacterized protein RhaS with RHS repeats
MESLVNPLGESSRWEYCENDWLRLQTLHNGATADYTYDPRGFLAQLLHRRRDPAAPAHLAPLRQGHQAFPHHQPSPGSGTLFATGDALDK